LRKSFNEKWPEAILMKKYAATIPVASEADNDKDDGLRLDEDTLSPAFLRCANDALQFSLAADPM